MDLSYAIHSPLCLAVSLLCSLAVLTWALRRQPPPLLIGHPWRCKGRERCPPVAGTILHMFVNFRRLYDYLTELSRRHKTFRMLTPSRSLVYTVDPANVEYILKTNFENYGKGPYLTEVLNDLLGDGIFTVDGQKWRHQRKVASHEFSTKVLRDYSSVVFRKNAAKFAQIISDASTSQHIVDIQDLLMRFTMDSVFEVSLGEDINTLSGSCKDAYAFAKAFDASGVLTLHRFFDPLWKIKRRLNIGSEATLKKNLRVIDDFVYGVIQRKRDQMADQRHDLMKKQDILSRFLVESKVRVENENDMYLRDITLCFILAGKDTTANTLSWFFYLLCDHPDVQEKIAQEVKEVTKTSSDLPIEDFMAHLTEQALNNMQYLHAALSETLRLYPALPTNGKYCYSDDILPDGSIVKKGDIVNYQSYSMGRMEDLWGEDARDFRPERWLNNDGIFQPESPFKFTAFQAGPRVCLGKEFSYRQMMILTATLLHRFLFKLSNEQKLVKYKIMLTLHIDGGLHVHAHHR